MEHLQNTFKKYYMCILVGQQIPLVPGSTVNVLVQDERATAPKHQENSMFPISTWDNSMEILIIFS